MVKKKVKFDPNEPMELVMERLDPVYRDEAERQKAETDPFVREQALRSAYAILKNGGARTADELKRLQGRAK